MACGGHSAGCNTSQRSLQLQLTWPSKIGTGRYSVGNPVSLNSLLVEAQGTPATTPHQSLDSIYVECLVVSATLSQLDST